MWHSNNRTQSRYHADRQRQRQRLLWRLSIQPNLHKPQKLDKLLPSTKTVLCTYNSTPFSCVGESWLWYNYNENLYILWYWKTCFELKHIIALKPVCKKIKMNTNLVQSSPKSIKCLREAQVAFINTIIGSKFETWLIFQQFLGGNKNICCKIDILDNKKTFVNSGNRAFYQHHIPLVYHWSYSACPTCSLCAIYFPIMVSSLNLPIYIC